MKDNVRPQKAEAFLRFEYVPGSLDSKTRELVLLAGAAVAGCSH